MNSSPSRNGEQKFEWTRERIEALREEMTGDFYIAPWTQEAADALVKLALAGLSVSETGAIKAIEEHNAECVRLCDDRKRCGYEKYRPYMSCSDCPKDWIIDMPAERLKHE